MNTTLDESRTVLQHFLCREFGYPDTPTMLRQLDGVDPNICGYRDSDYAAALYLGAKDSPVVTPDQMVEYDQRLSKHNKSMERPMADYRPWTPPLYLALLFTERYLDRYFNDHWELLDDLNRAKDRNPSARSLPEYTRDDLQALAVHSNADSGESRLAHFHVLQYQHWAKRLNNILLLVPDRDAVARQEHGFTACRIRARAFHPEAASPMHMTVEIIELRQFGPASDFARPLQTREFSPDTLVLVDEGHLNPPVSKIWRKLRPEFLMQGFVCEYCSSFRQAAGRAPELRERYEKCLLFDFPWRWAREAGYGKEPVLMSVPAGM